jgi:hypothetical protein
MITTPDKMSEWLNAGRWRKALLVAATAIAGLAIGLGAYKLIDGIVQEGKQPDLVAINEALGQAARQPDETCELTAGAKVDPGKDGGAGAARETLRSWERQYGSDNLAIVVTLPQGDQQMFTLELYLCPTTPTG